MKPTGKYRLQIHNLGPAGAKVTELSGPLNESNTAAKPDNIVPKESSFEIKEGKARHTFPPHSFTVVRFE